MNSSRGNPPNRNRRREEEEPSLENIVLGGLALGGLLYGGYKLTQTLFDSTPAQEERSRVSEPSHYARFSPGRQTTFQKFCFLEGPNSPVISVDATPSRAGGVLILPRSNKIYYYSMDWSRIFRFPRSQASVYYRTNVTLAMEVFKRYVKQYQDKYGITSIYLKLQEGLFEGIVFQEPYSDFEIDSGIDIHTRLAERLASTEAESAIRSAWTGSDDDDAVDISIRDFSVLHTVALKFPYLLA